MIRRFLTSDKLINLDPGTTEIWDPELLGTGDFVGVVAVSAATSTRYHERWLVFKDTAQPTRGNLELNDFPAGLAPFFDAIQSNKKVKLRDSNSNGSFKWDLHTVYNQSWPAFKAQALSLMDQTFMNQGETLAGHVRGFDGHYDVITLTQPLIDGYVTAEVLPKLRHISRVRLGGQLIGQLIGRVYAESPANNTRVIYQIAAPSGVVEDNGGPTVYDNDGIQDLSAFLDYALTKQNDHRWIFTRGEVTHHPNP